MIIYLAGKISGQRELAQLWREEIIKKYNNKYHFLNPLRRNQFNQEIENHTEIVIGDKADIDACDIVLAYINDGPSFGTSMEIMYAYMKGKPVVCVSEIDYGAWLNYHTIICKDFDEAFNKIEKMVVIE